MQIYPHQEQTEAIMEDQQDQEQAGTTGANISQHPDFMKRSSDVRQRERRLIE